MRIQKKLNQHRRDFHAVYRCEHCGHEVEGYGYDDSYFHEEVIPGMICENCGRTSEGTVSSAPDVPPGATI